MTNSENNDKISEMRDDMFEAMLKVAAKAVAVKEVDELLRQEELEGSLSHSEGLEKRFMKSLRKYRKAERNKRVKKTTYRVAASFGLFFLIGSLIVMSVEASRNFIFNAIINIRSDHIALGFGQGITDNEGIRFVLGYMSQGFELISSQGGNNMTSLTFSDNSNRLIIITQHTASSLYSFVDNENREFALTSIGGMEAYKFEAADENEFSMIKWSYESDVFSVAGTIEFHELMLIAENLTPN